MRTEILYLAQEPMIFGFPMTIFYEVAFPFYDLRRHYLCKCCNFENIKSTLLTRMRNPYFFYNAFYWQKLPNMQVCIKNHKFSFESWLENDFCPILYSLFFFFIFRSEIRLMTQQHAISKEGVTYQELQEMKNKLMALLENNATIYNLVQKYPFGMNWFLILFPTLFQMHYSCLKRFFFLEIFLHFCSFDDRF